jgi:site-specific DNA-methyltransferase (cytosine-N4-specific)
MSTGVETLDRQAKRKLELIADADWHFADAKTQTGVHGVHPYPAKFIPQIPRQLIALLADRPELVVFDPFCGSGTTLVEAQAAGHPSIGVDLNPIATLIARVKTRRSSDSITDLAADITSRARKTAIATPDIPRIDHWFAQDVKCALAALGHQIAQITDDAVRDDLRLAWSSIIVRVSFQDGDTRYAAVPKAVSGELVFDLFERAASDLDSARQAHFDSLFSRDFAAARVITSDILSVSPEEIGPVDLVITSPPYPNAYEYWLYHKYRMYWLGFDPIAVREAEIGARPHFFKKNHHTAVDFERQMATVFRLLRSTLLPHGVACFVVGNSKIHGEIVDNVDLLKRAASRHGFSLLTIVHRNVPNTRKAFNPANARTIAESIAVFGRS